MYKYAQAVNSKHVYCLKMLSRRRQAVWSWIWMLLLIVQAALVFFWKVDIFPDISAAHMSDWASNRSSYCLPLAGPRKVHQISLEKLTLVGSSVAVPVWPIEWSDRIFQWCADKHLQLVLWKYKNNWFVAFDSLNGVNILTMTDFKLPVWVGKGWALAQCSNSIYTIQIH